MKVARALVFWLFVFCLPVLIFTTILRWEVSEIRLYEYGFDKYGISEVTGIDAVQLQKIAQHLIDYFNLKADSVQVTVTREGQQFDLFNEREVVHLEDVRDLVQLDFRVQLVVLVIMIACILVLWVGFKEGWRTLVRGLFWGSVVTLSLMLFLALWAVVGFERLFILFHLVSFSNEYWILDPTRDYLIMLFPGGFFYDAALLCFGTVTLKSLVIGGTSFAVLKLVDKNKR
jgi:integral membrane protein (TIGR01906 family)